MSIKEFMSESLTNLTKSLSKIFIKKSDIVNDLNSTDTDKPQAAYQGKVLSETIETVNKNTNELNQSNYYMRIGRQRPSAPGWYRIAKFVTNNNNCIYGASDNSIDIILKRSYDNNNNEHHELKFLSIFNNRKFMSVANLSNYQLFTKIRYTNNGFLEIYYNASVPNTFSYTILQRYDSWLFDYWETVWEISDTTDDQVLVTFDIPANDN